MPEGILVFHNTTYAIYQSDGTRILLDKEPRLSSLIPGDTVRYEGTKLMEPVRRQSQTTLGIIRGLVRGQAYLFCPLLKSLYNPAIPRTSDMTVGDRYMISIAPDFTPPVILSSLGSVYNRLADLSATHAIYMNSGTAVPLPTHVQTPLYTKPFEDLSHLPTFSIDPEGSLDADDALTVICEERRVLVHIVDIHQLITPDLEAVALQRAFTLYLPNNVTHLLPPEKAEFEFSLKEGQPRHVITVDLRFDENGVIQHYDLYPSLIVNKRAWTYEEVMAEIGNSHNSSNSSNSHSAFAYLQTFLPLSSAPSITVPALRQTIDPVTGKLSTFSSILNTDAAHKIIEVMMIAANLTVSKHIGASSSVPQRFHAKLPKTVSSVPAVSGNPIVDSFLAMKTFATATYDTTQQGHFGLQLTSYTHFTSPIRRYFDVIIHHLLAGITYEPTALQELLEHVNRQERTVELLQKLYVSWKLCDWLQDRIGHVFEGYITGLVGAGVYFLIPDLMLDGFVHASKLSIAPVLGQSVALTLTDVNQITGQTGFKI